MAVVSAGLQVPVMAGVLVELSGKAGAVLFWQSGATGAKVGITAGLTVMSIVVIAAHCPASGVNM